MSLCGVAACASRMVGDGSSVAPRWCLKKVPGLRLAARSVLMRDGWGGPRDPRDSASLLRLEDIGAVDNLETSEWEYSLPIQLDTPWRGSILRLWWGWANIPPVPHLPLGGGVGTQRCIKWDVTSLSSGCTRQVSLWLCHPWPCPA